MDLLGHCEIAVRCGRHSSSDFFGAALIDLMLPNLLHCHDWCYANLWELDHFSGPLEASASLVRTHMVADWVIHYGDADTTVKKKRGWAYRRMGLAKRSAQEFFNGALKLDLLEADARLPVSWDKRMHLDFAHSMVEYSLDLLFADRLGRAEFLSICKVLASLSDAQGESRLRLSGLWTVLGATSDQSAEFLKQGIQSIARDGELADRPDFFAVSTAVRKYGFKLEPTSYRYVRHFLEQVAGSLDSEEVVAMLEGVAAVAASPEGFYRGTLKMPLTSAI